MNSEFHGYDLTDLSKLVGIEVEKWPKRIYQNPKEYIRATEAALLSSGLDPDSYVVTELKRGLVYMKEQESKVANELRSAFEKDIKSGIYEIAIYLIELHKVKSIKGTKRELFVYEEGVYVAGDDTLKMAIRELLGELCTTHYITEILETIRDRTAIGREKFIVNVDLINLNNGVLDIRTGALNPHDPRNLFFTKIPIDFNPNADCPTIKEYLSEVLEEDQIRVVQEWLGYTLYREYFIKKALICVGEGDTGKTTLLNLICAFIGERNLSGVSLQRITYDKFAAANLYNKHLNQYDDLSFKDIQDNGAFKMATGGGFISGEKKFGDQFVFKNYAKLTFTCNKIPDVKDATDDAYFNRWIVLPFTRIIEEEKKDRRLIHKMTTATELSGLLNFALEGLKRILENQNFSYDKQTHEIKTEMMRSASSIARFASDCLEEAGGEWISKEGMYQVYGDYAGGNKIPAVSMKAFGSRLPMYAPYIAEFKPKDPKGKKQITAWRNVKLKVAQPDDFPTDSFDEPSQPSLLDTS